MVRARELPADALMTPALVFSPHFDDETLGCGGTVLRKRAAGVPVSIVYMTDGRKSHANWMDEEELSKQRRAEGQKAAEALGVNDVYCLGFEETRLPEHREKAIARVAELLESHPDYQLFVPARDEGPVDHGVTFEVVVAALGQLCVRPPILEYPIWAWNQWPWTPYDPAGKASWPKRTVRRARRVARFLGAYSWRVDVSEVLGRKRNALHQHASQVARPAGHADWPILADVEGGEFLACFFRSHEVFAERGF